MARQLGVDPGVLDGYGSRAQTRTDHVNQVKAHLGFCSATNADLQDAGTGWRPRHWAASRAAVWLASSCRAVEQRAYPIRIGLAAFLAADAVPAERAEVVDRPLSGSKMVRQASVP